MNRYEVICFFESAEFIDALKRQYAFGHSMEAQ